jgi:preprotein translocase subunit SecE
MGQESKDKKPAVDEDGESEAEGEGSSEVSSDAGDASDASDSSDSSEHGSSETLRAGDDEALVKADADAGETDGEEGEGEEVQAAAQLGADRYVLAGFFAAGMLGAYVLGRAIQSMWVNASNKDWFAQRLPALAAVSDEDKGMYGILLGGLIALVTVYRTYQKPEVRTWADEVAAELAKVVWPSRKEVTSSTFIVIVSSAVATLYLALLDRLWAFITNIVYGDGS